MGFEFGKVDFNDFVVFGIFVCLEEVFGSGCVCSISDGVVVGSVEVLLYVGGVGEGRGGCVDFGIYVGNGGKISIGLCGDVRFKVFNDMISIILKFN